MGIKKEILVELMKKTVDVKPLGSNTTSYIWFVIYVFLFSTSLRIMLTTTAEFDILILFFVMIYSTQNLMHYMFRLKGFFIIGGLIAIGGILPPMTTELIVISYSFILGCMVAYFLVSIDEFMKKD